jgi:tRNA pseudouridine55 synthase
MPPVPFGFLNIDKPGGMTSHDVVNRVRRAFTTRQVGHAGTLDPFATGVLVVCVGGATRLSDYVMSEQKTYHAVVQFGTATDTYDLDGQVTFHGDPARIAGLTAAEVEAALSPFRGDILQTPPAYSAIKIDGRKLYERARAGEMVTAPPRPVTIHALSLDAWDNSDPSAPRAHLTVRCSAGTYIRSIAYDLGAALGVGAHLTALRRSASGIFALARAVPLDTLITDAQPTRHLIAPAEALAGYPSLTLDADDARALRQGRPVAAPAAHVSGTLVMAYEASGRLIAVTEARADGRLHPHKVFPPNE